MIVLLSFILFDMNKINYIINVVLFTIINVKKFRIKAFNGFLQN